MDAVVGAAAAEVDGGVVEVITADAADMTAVTDALDAAVDIVRVTG